MRKTNIFLIVLVLTVLFTVGGCSKKNNEGSPPGKPINYLPMKIGTTWTYKIEIGEVEPLNHERVIWPQGKTSLVYVTRGRFISYLKREENKIFYLKMRIKGLAAKQGGLEFPIGVELEIEKDELGVFDNAKQVFWAGTSRGSFMAHEVITYPPHSPGAPTGSWGTWGVEDGYSMRILFFGKSPGTEISMGENAIDSLLFTGVERVPGTRNINGLHFVRTVKASQKDEKDEKLSILDRAFSEDVWFVKGKGLFRLEQKVEGKKSMTWTLVDFSE